MNVRRFAPGDGFDHDEMVSDTEGSFVMFADYEELLTQHTEQSAEIARLRATLSQASEYAAHLRCYTHDWDWKYGQYWDSEAISIRAALAASEVK